MWYGQATAELTSWADQEVNRMRIVSRQKRLAKEEPVVEVLPVKKVRSYKGVISEFIPTEKLLELKELGYTQQKIADKLGMSRKAVQARLSRHKEKSK